MSIIDPNSIEKLIINDFKNSHNYTGNEITNEKIEFLRIQSNFNLLQQRMKYNNDSFSFNNCIFDRLYMIQTNESNNKNININPFSSITNFKKVHFKQRVKVESLIEEIHFNSCIFDNGIDFINLRKGSTIKLTNCMIMNHGITFLNCSAEINVSIKNLDITYDIDNIEDEKDRVLLKVSMSSLKSLVLENIKMIYDIIVINSKIDILSFCGETNCRKIKIMNSYFNDELSLPKDQNVKGIFLYDIKYIGLFLCPEINDAIDLEIKSISNVDNLILRSDPIDILANFIKRYFKLTSSQNNNALSTINEIFKVLDKHTVDYEDYKLNKKLSIIYRRFISKSRHLFDINRIKAKSKFKRCLIKTIIRIKRLAYLFFYDLLSELGTNPLRLLCFNFLFVFGFGIIYHIIEFKTEFLESLYFSGIVYTTIGMYGTTSLEFSTKIIIIFEGLFGISMLAYMMAVFVDSVKFQYKK